MAIDKEIKRKVSEDWQKAFPELTPYSHDKFYKVLGPVIIGLELIKLPKADEYRPHFVIYSLFGNKMGNDIKSCLSGPLLLREYYKKNGFQFSIPYDKHNIFFNDLLESVKNQTPLNLYGNVSLGRLISLFDEYSQTPPLNAAPNSYLQATLQEAKFKIALFVGIDEAKKVLEIISNINWDLEHFKACGIDLNNWIRSLEESIIKRDLFLKQIEANKQDQKVSKLKSSELSFSAFYDKSKNIF